MGQKVNPVGFRVGVTRGWDVSWCNERSYAQTWFQDWTLKTFLEEKLKHAGLASVLIERPSKRPRVRVYASRPGLVIGRKGEDIEKLRKTLSKKMGMDVSFDVEEVRRPELDARLVALSVAQQLEKRVSYKRAMRRAMQLAMKAGAQGIRVMCAGRLGGAEIARKEWAREGRVPLHKLRANIDYSAAPAHTNYGSCGVKVWIYKGDHEVKDPMSQSLKSFGGGRA